MLITYNFHNQKILRYLNHARSQIIMLKTMFTIYDVMKIENEQKTFNKFKFHVFNHYENFIKKFEFIDN